VAASGVAVLVVEHDVALLRRLCDRVTVLSEGRELTTGTPLQVTRNRQVRAVYLGPGPA
jgi:branched-chain amino acid transport system ATP-binding protein